MEKQEYIRPPQSDPERLNWPPGTPFIYVTSIADYMDNVRHSAWISADQAADMLQVQIEELMAASPDLKSAEPGIPGWFIEDNRGFYDLGLYLGTDLDEISRIGQGIAFKGEAFASFVVAHGAGPDVMDEFTGCYQATFINAEMCIDAFLESMGWQQAFDIFITEQSIEGLVHFVRRAIWRAYPDAWEVLETREGVIHVFSR